MPADHIILCHKWWSSSNARRRSRNLGVIAERLGYGEDCNPECKSIFTRKCSLIISEQRPFWLVTSVPMSTGRTNSWRVDIKIFNYDPSLGIPADTARRDYMEDFVEKVLSHTGDSKKPTTMSFHVKWLNYDNSHNTWEPWKNLRLCEALHVYRIYMFHGGVSVHEIAFWPLSSPLLLSGVDGDNGPLRSYIPLLRDVSRWLHRIWTGRSRVS